MRLQSSAISALVVGVALFSHSSDAGEQLAGTYRLVLCSGPCNLEPAQIVAHGILVLFPGAVAEAAEGLEQLRYISPDPYRGGRLETAANSCFAISGARSIGGRELYAGIIPRALTYWGTAANGEFWTLLYTSPDAWFHLLGKPEGNMLQGRGRQHDFHGEVHEPVWWQAERLGEPDLGKCRE
jgi:hypothetical protein